MSDFITDMKALFKKKYKINGDEVEKSLYINLPPDIKPNNKNKVNKQVRDNDADEFATFTISSSRAKPNNVSSNKQLGRWIIENESSVINGRSIKRGFYYFGGQLKTLTGFGTEPSLLDESLSINPPKVINSFSQIYSDESLGYWPSFERLSSKSRGTYLDWLASDRDHTSTPIGYVFIYFGGFERRVIEHINDDIVSNDEFISIYTEVSRLNRIYGRQSQSFDSYSTHFLEFMTLIRSPLFEDKEQTGHLSSLPVSSQNLSFKMRLAKRVVLQLPVSTTLAWEWLVYSNEYNFKTPAKRCEKLFKDYFDVIYNEIYPDGFIVAPNKTKLKINYDAASRSIVRVELTLDDLPDPSVLRAPVKKIIDIVEQCNEALDAYSRYLGKEGNSVDDIAALMLLPKALINQQTYQNNHPIVQKFKIWAESVVENDEGLTTTSELWKHLDEPLPQASGKALSKKQNELITNLVELAGFGIAPDQRYHQTSLQTEGYAVLFTNGHGADFQPSASFKQVSLAMRLGAMVATINGYVDVREVDTLLTLIDQDSHLSVIEKKSLTAYLLWRLNTSSNMAGLKAELATIDKHHISFISRFIVSVALANGNVEPSQIKQIEKLYNALGLDKALVTSDIHHLTTNKKTNNVFSNTLPKNSDIDENASNLFVFDTELLALHERETGDAKAMLASIFATDDNDIEDDNDSMLNETLLNEQIDSHAASNNELIIKGLDRIHSKLYQQLISKEVWQREEAEVLCESLNLMINGAIETINDWAYDNVDAPVLEDDDEVVIDFEIVEELRVLG